MGFPLPCSLSGGKPCIVLLSSYSLKQTVCIRQTATSPKVTEVQNLIPTIFNKCTETGLNLHFWKITLYYKVSKITLYTYYKVSKLPKSAMGRIKQAIILEENNKQKQTKQYFLCIPLFCKNKPSFFHIFLLGGWTTHLKKYARQIGNHFP